MGDLGSLPGSGRSPGEGNGNPLQYSCLENSMDRGTVHGVAKANTTERLTLELMCKFMFCRFILGYQWAKVPGFIADQVTMKQAFVKQFFSLLSSRAVHSQNLKLMRPERQLSPSFYT